MFFALGFCVTGTRVEAVCSPRKKTDRFLFKCPRWSIMDQILPWREETPLHHCDVTGHLLHPLLIRMRRHAGHVDLPAREVEKKQHVIRHESSLRPHCSGEEVGKSVEEVDPVTKAFPEASTAMLAADSSALPPKYVE